MTVIQLMLNGIQWNPQIYSRTPKYGHLQQNPQIWTFRVDMDIYGGTPKYGHLGDLERVS